MNYSKRNKKNMEKKNIVCHFHSGAGGARVKVAAKEGANWKNRKE